MRYGTTWEPDGGGAQGGGGPGLNFPLPTIQGGYTIPGTNITIGTGGQPVMQPGIFDQFLEFVRNNQGLVVGGLVALYLLRRR